MRFQVKYIAAIIAILVIAGLGVASAQNPDLTQNPVPDQATVPSQDQGPANQGQTNQGQMEQVPADQAPMPDQNEPSMDQDRDLRSSPSDSMNGSGGNNQNGPTLYKDDQPDQQNDQQRNDQPSGRPPMSELPPPLKPSPNIQGPGPYGNPRPGPMNGPGNSPDYNESSSKNAVARISLIHGDVSTQRGDSGDWSAAQLNAPLMTGDKISTGDKARTEVQLDYANILRLAEHTQANITNLTRSNIQIQLGHGMANYTVMGRSDADAEIDTPNVAIRTERRDSSFRILITADDHTEVLVRRGEVEITTPQGGTRVGANQFITIRGTGDQTQYRIGEAPTRDDWDQWNADRDHMIGNSISRRNTNPYYTGSQDLDNNGTWRDVPDYGQSWFPNVGPGWAPYSAGTWVWEPYWGWTWVSYEPWGWAPYHYGRWFLYNGAWGWWPGPVYPWYRPLWAPAYVSFFGFGPGFGVGFGFGFGWGSIGWFALGPGDFFHPWWGGWGGRFGYTGFYGWNRGGFAPLHAGGFSNVHAAMTDPHFRGATSVAANQFGQGHANFQSVSHASMQNAHFATGNLPVTPTRASLSASGRPAAASTLRNSSASQHFFSPHGASTAAGGHSFEREQAQVNNAMRQSGVSPLNRNQSSMESRNNARSGESGARGLNNSAENAARSNGESHGNSNEGSSRAGAGNSPGRESGSTSNGGWQKFTPMAPRAEAPGRSGSGAEAENRGYGSSRGYSGSPEARGSEGRGDGGYEGRGYGNSRPPLNMRQPILTPRGYGNPYGGRGGYPGYGGRAPGSGGGRSAPGYGGGHSSPGGHSGGGSSHGGGGGHGGGHR